MSHRYVMDTPGLLHTSPDGSTAKAVQTSQRDNHWSGTICATSHIHIRVPLKVLKQSSLLVQTRIIPEANNTGQQTTRDSVVSSNQQQADY